MPQLLTEQELLGSGVSDGVEELGSNAFEFEGFGFAHVGFRLVM